MPHTPGPWFTKATSTPSGISLQVRSYTESVICLIKSSHGNKKDNGFLIASAPDLLAEIEKQIEWLRYIKNKIKAEDEIIMGFDQSIKYLSKVAAKARGK